MNADVLVNSVKQEPNDISDILDKENVSGIFNRAPCS